MNINTHIDTIHYRLLQTRVKISPFMSLRTKRSNLIYKGSSGELKTQLHISKEVGYLSEEAFQELNSRAEKIAGMVGSLSRFSRLQLFSR